MQIENWGFNYENETAKGYLLYAIELLRRNESRDVISDELKDKLLCSMDWAFDEKTAEEAYQYYCEA